MGHPPTKVRPTCYSFLVFRARPAWGCWAEPTLGACPKPGTRSHHVRGGPWVSASNHRLARGWVCHRTMGRVRRNHEARAGAVTWASPEGTCPPPPLFPLALPFLLARFLSVSVFLFSRKSVRGKGKGQKRKRKKSRYKSWSVYVGARCCLIPRSLPGPPTGFHLQHPITLPLPSPCPVSLSHSLH